MDIILLNFQKNIKSLNSKIDSEQYSVHTIESYASKVTGTYSYLQLQIHLFCNVCKYDVTILVNN